MTMICVCQEIAQLSSVVFWTRKEKFIYFIFQKFIKAIKTTLKFQ